MITGTVFRNNQTQAVRLPKAVAFPDGVRRVSIRVEGDTRIVEPVYPTLHEWFQHRRCVDPDFLAAREQGTAEDRDGGELW
ncbi:MAG: antitoxin [Bifidobacteriaceae bacterium]|jgi:antitoxin VapB|nr:antitoxin [Bifidobacteriaceae bacterium]